MTSKSGSHRIFIINEHGGVHAVPTDKLSEYAGYKVVEKSERLVIHLISNINNGYGLQRDVELLSRLLDQFTVIPVHYRQPYMTTMARLNVFLEIFNPKFCQFAERNWVIPNPEWWFAQWTGQAGQVEKFLCKTKHAEMIFSQHGLPTVYTGFLSRNLYNPHVMKKRAFLHIAGASKTKNTLAVYEAWRDIDAPLYIISQSYWKLLEPTKQIRIYRHLDDDALARLMNACWFHVCPSAYEGWGHYIHEGRSTGAIIITTNAEPMRQFGEQDLLVQVRLWKTQNVAPCAEIDPRSLANVVRMCLDMSDDELMSRSKAAMDAYEQLQEDSRQRLLQQFRQVV